MYQASCDLKPECNIFWTTKKCIGEPVIKTSYKIGFVPNWEFDIFD
jgi:hypothetical protein